MTQMEANPSNSKQEDVNLVNHFLKRFRVDFVLAFASFVCFGTFYNRSMNQDRLSGIEGPIATLAEGTADRKATGTNLFIQVGPKSNLYNLDVIWIGKDKEAVIAFDSKTSVKLPEKTLLYLKRPFKNIATGQSNLEDNIKVLKGSVLLSTGDTIKPTLDMPESSPEAEEDPNTIKDQRVTIELYPKDNSIIYARPAKNIPLSFAWQKSVYGFIAIQHKESGHQIFGSLQNQNYYSAKLDQTGSYFWQIIDSDRRPIYGPFTFTLNHLDEETAKQLINSKLEHPTEVYW
jgi:hypothetical protein